jgi:transcriptional regulator with XRE-family HTH domain
MEIDERIKLVMEKKSLSVGAFADSIGVAQATVSHIMNGRNKPSMDVILKLYERYPDIRLEWLMTGKGSMTDEESIKPAGSEARTLSLFGEMLPAGNVPLHTTTVQSVDEARPSAATPAAAVVPERPPRRIVEIRIFFDDDTYQILKPEK